MRAYAEVEIWHHLLLISSLDGDCSKVTRLWIIIIQLIKISRQFLKVVRTVGTKWRSLRLQDKY